MTTRLQVGDPAPDLTLFNGDGETTALSNEWHHGPVILNFLRHFGCTFCRQAMARLEENRDDLAGVGLQVINIAMGEPKHIKRYCGKLAPHLACLGRTDDTVYRAYGLREGNLQELANANVAKSALGEFLRGNVGGMPVGNMRMMPGTFIIDTDGTVAYAYYSADIADHPTIDNLLQAAKNLKER